MATRLEHRLNQARRSRFVGRSAELELFRTALAADTASFAVLHIYGPGGVGKTTLLREYARLVREADRPLIHVDGRNLDPSPAGFLMALQLALNLSPGASPLDTAAAVHDLVLLIDTYELMAPLDAWLRQDFLPQLSEQALVVVAGRDTPSGAWRADDDWGALTRIVALRNLRPEESENYLLARGVPQDDIARLLEVTYGHPLALSLAADVVSQNADTTPLTIKQDPHIVHLLLERFVSDVPNPVFRQTLEICAHALTTDEGMLADCLGEEEAYAAFQWLRTLSFVDRGPHGLFPHDLAREALEADLRWRNFERFRELHLQVRNTIIRRAMQSTGMEQQYAIFALLFLHRNNPIMRPFFEWKSFGQVYIDQPRSADVAEIEQMVLRHQGPASLAVTRHWQKRQPQSFYVFRTSGSEVTGYCQVIDMSQLSPEDIAADPAMVTATAHLRAAAALRHGEVAIYFRNWMHRDSYQQSPSAFNMASTVSLRTIFQTPGLAYTFVCQADQERYRGVFEYLRMPLSSEAGFIVDGQEFGVFVHDWRKEPALDWLEIMGERELWDDVMPVDTPSLMVQPVVLSEPEFGSAVRQSLKDVLRPDLLAQNPLLRSRLLRDRCEAEPAPVQLQALLREAAETLTSSPRDLKLYRTLWHTYFEPAPTQEAAAELLDLPFSTYRYQLGKAVDRVVAWLWQQELYGIER